MIGRHDDGQICMLGQYTRDQIQSEANLWLIAAAPDLLAVLRLFADMPTDTPPPGITKTAWAAALDAARDAIARAEGEEE
jgi:hypothetical protein